MTDFIYTLQQEFKTNADSIIAKQQKAYLRDQFEFYGMKTPVRRAIQKPFLAKAYLPPKENIENLVKTLWNKPQREYHYFAQELAQKYLKKLEEKDILLFEYMVTHNSWWDTVDCIATKLIGPFFRKFPELRDSITSKWMNSGNIWLQRCCLIFQLAWKEKLDTDFLERTINSLLGSKEFFINKAIGWALRDYSRTDGEWVAHFATHTDLHPLSKREALRLLK